MSDDETGNDEFIESFREYLQQLDEVARVILNAHADIEAALNELLRIMFYYSDPLEEARLGFMQKVNVARAYMAGCYDAPDWKVIEVLNKTRNEVVHAARGDRRMKRLAELQRALLDMKREKISAKVSRADEKDVVVYAAATGSGFFLTLKDHLAKQRGYPVEDDE
jgi:protein-arginine kinase activator protein McsA